MEEHTLKLKSKVDVHSIIVLIILIIVLGFLFTWDFFAFSTTWTLRFLISLFFVVHLLNFACGFLHEDENNRFRWNKQLKMNRKVKEYAKAILTFLISSLFMYVIPVLLGAPFLSNCFETLHFAVLLSTMITFPGILTWGGDELKWLRIIFGTGCQTKWEFKWLNNCIFCLAGAWFGAFAIPLDWDRPWQQWPISCTYGSLIGYCAGLAYDLHHQQRTQLSEQRKQV